MSGSCESITIRGEVTGGNRIGSTLGFPTANIRLGAGYEALRDGVYAARVDLRGRLYQAMAYLGDKPTVGGSERLLEINLFGFEGNLYGERITVELVGYIREGRRFGSLEQLRWAVDRDREAIEEFFKS